MNAHGYQQYKEQSVNTMTKSEMLLLLLDELVKRIMRAEIALKQENYELFDQSITRAVEIVMYLKSTLNRKYEISGELSRMYDFFIFDLSRIKAGRDEAVILELRPLVEDLRNTFREAGKQVQN
ncbi:MAG: flagellar export chaperone FliS [Lachnospiraceae bacterium]|nr:flagellar export chaperone FliS [Lachnospiraceae bacterium]